MLIGLVLGAAASMLTPHTAAAQSVYPSPEIVCPVREVGVYTDRVHVFCGESGGYSGTGRATLYLSVEIDSPLAAHLVTIASAATVHGRPIAVSYDENAGNNPAGCAQNDCRRLLMVKGFSG